MTEESKNIQAGSSRCLLVRPREVAPLLFPGAFTEPIIMRKNHSPHMVRFMPDTDPHFITVELVKLATHEVKAQHFIIAPDLLQWIRMYRDDGFIPVEDAVQVAPPKRKQTSSISDKINKNCTTVVQK